MSAEAQLNELLLRWEELREQGETPRPQELCAACPELEEELTRRIQALQSFDALLCVANGRLETTTPRLQQDETLARTVAIPGYEILSELGRGGMGIVYKARQVSLNRIVALKMILSGAHAGGRELARFRTEAEASARLRHPHIVQIYEIGDHGGLPFLVLEFVDGGSLAEILKGVPQAPRQAARLAEILAQTVHSAHQQGIVHRDLKPANVLLVRRESTEAVLLGTSPENAVSYEPKIADFGLAKCLDAEAGPTCTGDILGTPSYMAPEQATGKTNQIGSATDIYALGAILYELLTGRPPFRGATPLDTLDQVRSEDPVPPSRLTRRVPLDLQTICLKCLRKEPRQRYASALDLAEDLRRFLAGEPIRARRTSVWERGVKWVQRRPALTLAALLVLSLFTAAGAVVYTLQLNTTLDALRVTESELQASRHQVRQQLYASDMKLAQQLWNRGAIHRVPQLLERHRPLAGDVEDRRGFEWHYLWRLHDRIAPATLGEHQGEITCAVFSPDGRILATASHDLTVKLWNTTTRQVRGTLGGHTVPVHFLVFSADGRTLSSASADQAIRVWEAATGKEMTGLPGHREPVSRLVLSPNGQLLAGVLGNQNRVIVREVVKGTEQITLNEEIPDPITALAFTPDSKTLAIATTSGRVRLCDAITAADRAVLRHETTVTAIAIANQGRTLAAGDRNGLVSVFDLASRVKTHAARMHQRQVSSVAFSPDGQTLASGDTDGIVRLWNTTTNRTGILKGHKDSITCLTFSPDGNWLTSATRDGAVKLWDPQLAQEFDSPQIALRPAGPFAAAPDGKTLAVVDQDQTVKLVDLVTDQVRSFLGPLGGKTNGIAYSPDGQTLAMAMDDGTVKLWDVVQGHPQVSLPAHRDQVLAIAFSPDGRLLASAGSDNRAKLWDLKTCQELGSLRAHTGAIEALAFAPDGKYLATGSLDGTVRLWDVTRIKECVTWPHGSGVHGLAFSLHGHLLATADGHGLVTLHDVAGQKKLGTIHASSHALRSVTFSPDSRTLAAAGEDTYVRLYDVRSRRLRHDFTGYVTDQVDFLPDSTALVTSSGQAGTLHLCDLKTWELRSPGGQRPNPVQTLAFSPDGKTLVTGSHAGQLRRYIRNHFWDPIKLDRSIVRAVHEHLQLWDVASRKSLPPLQAAKTVAVHPVVAFSGDGRLLASGAEDGTVWLWDRATRQKTHTFFVGEESSILAQGGQKIVELNLPAGRLPFTGGIEAVAFSPDSTILAAASKDGIVKLFKTVTGQPGAPLARVRGEVACLAFSPDGTLLATNHDSEVQIWNVATGELHDKLTGQSGPVRCVSFSPDSSLLATGSLDRQVRLWDWRAKQMKILVGHLGSVASLAFTPDGKTLATGSSDGTVKLWHVATAQELFTLEGHTGKVNSVAFSPDGTILATGGESANGSGEVYLWHADR